MKLKIKVKNKGTKDGWWEPYEEYIENPQEWAEKTIQIFNASLRPHETERELLEVEVIENNNDALHDWDKSIRLMSASYKGRVYDGMYCRKCGITGKRFGLNSTVKIDSKFKKKVFRRCDTAQAEKT